MTRQTTKGEIDMALVDEGGYVPPQDTTKAMELDAAVQHRSVAIGKLAAALSKAQGEIEGAHKGAVNPHFRSKYADLASVWDACREALAKHEIAVIQMPSAEGPNVTVTTTLCHSSGEWIQSALTMQAADAKPQTIGSAITYGRRYGLAAMVGVAPEDDDGNAAQGTAGAQSAQSSKPAAVPAKPPKYDEWRLSLTAAADNGTAVLKEAWAGTKEHPVMPAFRNYFNATEKEGTLDALKAKAAQAEAVPA